MRRNLIAAMALALVCAGCVHQKNPGVLVDPLQADIVFGLKPSTTTVPPAPALPPPIAPTASPPVPADQGNQPFALPVSLTGLSPSDCPTAALDAFPDTTAPVGVTSMPTVGSYRWQIAGGRAQGTSITPVSGKATRLIRRVTAIPKVGTDNADSTDFSFQVVEPYDTKGSVLILTYQVRTDNTGQRFVQTPTGPKASVYVTTPDSGMALVSEDVVDAAGNTVSLFHPAQPLLLLPLPIQPGGAFNSVAADPSTGQVTILQATVLRRARVDACGTIVEGWEVIGLERTTSVSSATGSPLDALLQVGTEVDNIYATQFGGMPIAEHTLQADPRAGTISVDDAIGQEKPGPLPAGTA